MNRLRNLRVLLVADAYKGQGSPALVIKRLIELLQSQGASVAVACKDIKKNSKSELGIELFPLVSSVNPIISQARPLVDPRDFKSVLNDFRPHIVHIVPSSIRISGEFIRIAKSKNIRVVSQIWGYNFYCSRNSYSVMRGDICTRCASGNFYQAIGNKCGSAKSRLLQVLTRYRYRESLLMSDAFLSSSRYLDRILLDYGVQNEKIFRLPLPFYKERVKELSISCGKHFVFYGQGIEAKGANLLTEIVNKTPCINYEFYFSGLTKESKNKFHLSQLEKNPKVVISTHKGWNDGISMRVASARGILLPSIWATTTETTLMECLSLGKPVIAFRVGIHEEIIEDGINGLLFDKGDIDGFCEGVVRLSNDDNLYEEISSNAVKLAEELTNSENLLSKLQRAYASEPIQAK